MYVLKSVSLKDALHCAVPENMLTPPMEGPVRNFEAEGVLNRHKLYMRINMKVKRKFQGGERVQPFIEEVWIFSETAH